MQPATKKLKTSNEECKKMAEFDMRDLNMKRDDSDRLFDFIIENPKLSHEEFHSRVCSDLSRFEDQVLVVYAFHVSGMLEDVRGELLTKKQWFILNKTSCDFSIMIGEEGPGGHSLCMNVDFQEWEIESFHDPFEIIMEIDSGNFSFTKDLSRWINLHDGNADWDKEFTLRCDEEFA